VSLGASSERQSSIAINVLFDRRLVVKSARERTKFRSEFVTVVTCFALQSKSLRSATDTAKETIALEPSSSLSVIFEKIIIRL